MAERLEKPSGELLPSARPEKVHKTPDPRPHYVELDALRGIGILGVVLAHAVGRWDSVTNKPLIIPLLDIQFFDLFLFWGGFGVTLFFLLSGYLLVGTEGRRASRGNYSLRAYALRRALRLIPAYYFALVVCLLVWPGTPTLTDTLLHLAVLQSFVPDFQGSAYDPAWWYLTSEVVFYAMLPLLVLKIRGLYARLALFGALLAASLAISAYMLYVLRNAETVSETYAEYLLHFPLTHLWLFVAGGLLRMLVEHLNERSPGAFRPVLAFSLFVGPLVLLPLFPYIPFLGILMDPHLPTVWLAIPFFAAAVLGSPVLSRILSWRPLVFVGIISYSLYLLHNTVLMLVKVYALRLAKPLLKHLDGAALWIVFAGYLGVMLVVAGVVAYLSYRYIESPFLRYKPK